MKLRKRVIRQFVKIVLVVTRNLKVSVVVERDEDGWFVGSVPELPGCHTQAKSLDELMKRMREAVEAYLETEGKKAVKDLKTEFVGVQLLEVEA